jgi:choline dehydrogenase-like flavoprotein
MCRIATNPADGVVDENLLVHGSRNTFVCDASVLPSTGATNTALTVGALAHRLSEHLKSIFSGHQAGKWKTYC